MPVAHSLTDALEEIEAAVAGLSPGDVWTQPAGAASIGFHLKHVVGALDRLFSYARGDALTPDQMRALGAEADPGDPPATAEDLLADVRAAIADAVDVLRGMADEALLEPRLVGRAGLPSNVQGLLFHAAEHTRRHAGQVIVTARVVRATEGRADTRREALIEAAVRVWEDTGVQGLCAEGRFEAAIGAMRALLDQGHHPK
jgi:uncharacterized damage-inducible protein DinB